MQRISDGARVLLLALALVAGCATARPTVRDPGAQARGRALLLQAVAAHGGLARWITIGGVTLRLRASDPFHFYPADSEWLLDPARNRALARFWTRKGPVEWRYDGQRATILENARCVGRPYERKKVAGLMSNLLFWFGVPFKFLDQGAEVVDAGRAPLPEGGPPMPRLFVTYHGVGDTPEDWFLVYLDPETHLIARIVYVASAVTTHVEFEGSWGRYRPFGGFEIATERRYGPKREALRALAPPVVQVTSEVRTHAPLDDSYFAAPAGCS